MFEGSSKAIALLAFPERLCQVGTWWDLHPSSSLGITHPLCQASPVAQPGEMQPEGLLFKLISLKKSDLS